MTEIPRSQLFVDRKLQGDLLVRATWYCVTCLMLTTALLLIWRLATGSTQMLFSHVDDIWSHCGPALVASLFVIPIVIVDMLRLSNRFAGPLTRMRCEMRRLAEGESVAPVQFREDDFWQPLAEEFNAVSAELDRLRAEVARAQQSGRTMGEKPQTDQSSQSPVPPTLPSSSRRFS